MSFENRFARRLQEAPTPLGTWLMSASATCAEALGWSGLDFLVVDMEHVPIELPDMVDIHRALAGTPAGTITRLPWNDAVTVKRVLDAGAQTLMFPMVQTPEQAAAAVRATRYPPAGIRGVAAVHRASHYGTLADYLVRSGPELFVIVQVETVEAYARMPEIAAVDGVDAVFIGPGDLAASMGHLGDVLHPEVQAAVRQAPQAVHRAGRKAGVVAPTAELARSLAEVGYDFVAIGSDLAAMNATIKSHMGVFGRQAAAPAKSAGY
ncbi:MAG: 2-dehydro-3-deoxyglucarate aldolase [Proteobacteria bacterium]|nr:2-dehydro-3-deoxyglucarate aldolase [Pseudomonadota bacterium]